MIAMGFEPAQVQTAMRAAFYNSDRAIEYLLTVTISELLQTSEGDEAN